MTRLECQEVSDRRVRINLIVLCILKLCVLAFDKGTVDWERRKSTDKSDSIKDFTTKIDLIYSTLQLPKALPSVADDIRIWIRIWILPLIHGDVIQTFEIRLSHQLLIFSPLVSDCSSPPSPSQILVFLGR